MKDQDVQNESMRIGSLNLEKSSLREPLVVKDLTKIYKKSNGETFRAVDNLSFGVLPTECFGYISKTLIKYYIKNNIKNI